MAQAEAVYLHKYAMSIQSYEENFQTSNKKKYKKCNDPIQTKVLGMPKSENQMGANINIKEANSSALPTSIYKNEYEAATPACATAQQKCNSRLPN